MTSDIDQNRHVNSEEVSELIGLIYDVAMDVNQWPALTQALSKIIVGLSDEAAEQSNKNDSYGQSFDVKTFLEQCYNNDQSGGLLEYKSKHAQLTSQHNMAIGEMLLPHFERAAKLSQHLHHASHVNETLETVLDYMPIGIILADTEGKILGKNHQADIILQDTDLLTISKNKIVTNQSDSTKYLHSLISRVCESNKNTEEDAETFLVKNKYGGFPVSLLITPTYSSSVNKSHVIIFVAAPEVYSDIPLTRLQALYDLTTAESRMLKGLVNGKDLQTISNENGVAISTTRSHLKSAFAKTNTTRQSELVRLVLVSPAIVSTSGNSSEAKLTGIRLQEKENSLLLNAEDHCITLADGRKLFYREYGKPDGYPVILMHAAPGSRQQIHPDFGLITKLGIRLIAPDRPGFGLSTPQANRTIPGWCDDIDQLLKHTGIDKFGVISYGAGTPYALAVAAAYPDAVQHISLMSAVLPEYSLRDLRGIGIVQRMVYISARNIPSVLVQMIKKSAQLIQKDLNKYMEVVEKIYSEPDLQLLSDPVVMLNLKSGLLDSVNSEGRYFAQDIILQVRDWGINLNEIKTPVRIWHGEQNSQNPIQFSIKLTQALPQCELFRIADAGHFLIYSEYWVQALSNAAGINR